MLTIYSKELLELTRDKKTLIFTLLLPTMILPGIMFLFIYIVNNVTSEAIEEEVSYAVVGGDYYPALAMQIDANEKFKRQTLPKDADLTQLINHNQLDFILILTKDAQVNKEQGLTIKVEMLYDDSTMMSTILFDRINQLLEELRKEQTKYQYQNFNLSEVQGKSVNNPIEIIEKTTVSKRESVGEKVGAMFPYILILIAFSGALYPAIDLGAGEKERGTLETLLLTPVPRFHIVVAKFLVIFTTSFVSVFLTLLSFGVMVSVFGQSIFTGIMATGEKEVIDIIDVMLLISVFDVSLMVFMLVPIAAIFGAVLLSVSIYARTFKEAQNYMQPMAMLVFLPLFLTFLPGVELDVFWASIPITNVALAIKEIFKGSIDVWMMAIIFSSTAVMAAVLLAFCNWWFQREQVLFRN